MRALKQEGKQLMIIACIALFSGPPARAQDCVGHASSFNHGVVNITVKKTKKETGEVIEVRGTGFIVSPQGFVITADHLVSRDTTIDDVLIEGNIGSKYAAGSALKVIEENSSADIAMLRFLDTSRSYAPVRLGCPWKVRTGDQMCSLGYSSKPEQDYHVNTGPLSSLSGEDKPRRVNDLWTTQIPSNEGESGSPVLLISDGAVIAVKYGGVPSGQGQNVNYLIPIYHAQAMLLTYTGSALPQCQIATEQLNSQTAKNEYASAVFSDFKGQVVRSGGDHQIIPVGGWREFEVKVVDNSGNPVEGAKVAWQTPTGGSLTYVAETDKSGIARATNLYTFPTKGTYFQTARIVDPKTPVGFVESGKLMPAARSSGTVFTFDQQ